VTFPQTNLPIHVEYLRAGTTWVDMAALGHVYTRDPVQIRRGLSGEGQAPEPSQCALTIENPGGLYSPRKADGANYGLIGRNTQLRVSVDQATSYLSIDADTATAPVGGCYVSTPDAAAIDITGDIDIRWDGDLSSWSESMELIGKWTETGNQRSYRLSLQASGRLAFWWSTNGTGVTAFSSEIVPISSGRQAVRVTLAVATGALSFYTSDTISGTWTQLGGTGITGATSIFAGSSPAYILENPGSNASTSVIRGRVFAAQIRAGIGGTIAANPDFTAQAHAATSFVDSAGRTWTLTGAVSLQKRDYRFWGEVPSWPTKWDISGRDVYVPLQAAGPMRRLGQGASPLRSAIYRSMIGAPSIIAYWPAEDGSGSTSVASGLDGSLGATGSMIVKGDPNFGANTQFPGSDAIPTMNGGSFYGNIRNHVFSNTAGIQFRFIGVIPTGTANTSVIARMFVRGTAYRWDLTYLTGGSLSLTSWDVDGTLLSSSGIIGFTVDDRLLRFSIELKQNGGSVDYSFGVIQAGDPTAGYFAGTFPLQTIGAPSQIVINPKGMLTDAAIGHISYQNTITTMFDVRTQINGYIGETAGRRFQRLCREEGITSSFEGNLDETTPMGTQRALPVLDLLAECAAVDGGQLFEPRNLLGLGFRTRESLQSQQAALQVPYGSVVGLEPVDDDQQTRNDVTASRPGGSTARAVLSTGALSTQDPPNGVGRYDTQIETNVADDSLLPDAAGWLLHVGTVDEPRYPTIEIEEANPRIYGSAAVLAQLVALDLGDRIEVSNPPAWLPPEIISQLVVGWSENLEARSRSLALVCVPASPYAVPRFGPVGTTVALARPVNGRYSTATTTLVGAQTTTSTSWAITTPAPGRSWTTDPAMLPLDWMMAGERVTVTAITGTGINQTATVVRSVNGVVKAHTAGEPVTLYAPAYYG
jgi:hypothetical protein